MSSMPLRVTEKLLDDPRFARLKDYLIRITGLNYYTDKDDDLARRIRRRLNELALQDCSSYLDLLCDPNCGPKEMDALIREITIGETYFFRHREHFDALPDVVLSDLIGRNSHSRRLRVWSAGCADGAEAYSISILLRRDYAHPLVGWNVSILGTDINRHSVTSAQEGRFDAWSLRSTPENVRRDCFVENGKQWAIAPELKAGVSFQVHNLVEDVYPPHSCEPFDLIICRNVMIYFSLETMRRMVAKFYESLTPGGWLLVGPSEPNMTCFSSFKAVNAPGVTLYQKPVTPVPAYTEPTSAIPSPITFPILPFSSAPSDLDLPAARPLPQVTSPAVSLAGMQEYANQGNWKAAAECGDELLRADNLNSLVHLNYALVLEKLGKPIESERSLRRAIYLDRKSILAHYQLGLLLQGRGDTLQAVRFFENAARLLHAVPDEIIVPDFEGSTAAELRKHLQLQVASLKDPA